jgi:hypothetical protein
VRAAVASEGQAVSRATSEPIDLEHGQRVQIGFGGPSGTVKRCKRKPPNTGHYYKVLLDDGSWVWPDRLVAESAGPHECRCVECGLRFRSQQMNDVLCPHCDKYDSRRAADEALPGAHIRQPIKESAVALARARAARGRDLFDEPPPPTDDDVPPPPDDDFPF